MLEKDQDNLNEVNGYGPGSPMSYFGVPVADTRAMFDEYGVYYTYYENAYGHDWFSGKDYLARFAPLLFR